MITSEVVIVLLNIVGYFTICALLLKISIYDIKFKTIEDSMNLYIGVIGFVLTMGNRVFYEWIQAPRASHSLTFSAEIKWFLIRVLTVFIVPIGLIIINLIIKNGIGGGDIKLVFALGFLFDIETVLEVIIIGGLLSGIFGIGLILYNKYVKSTCKNIEFIPFAPFITIGVYSVIMLKT